MVSGPNWYKIGNKTCYVPKICNFSVVMYLCLQAWTLISLPIGTNGEPLAAIGNFPSVVGKARIDKTDVVILTVKILPVK